MSSRIFRSHAPKSSPNNKGEKRHGCAVVVVGGGIERISLSRPAADNALWQGSGKDRLMPVPRYTGGRKRVIIDRDLIVASQ